MNDPLSGPFSHHPISHYPFSMTPDALNAHLGCAQAPRIVDICLDEDHALDPRVFPGARRMAFTEAAQAQAWAKGQAVVIVCQKGLKLSQGVAAAIRARGGDGRYLEGGQVVWAAAGLALFPTALDPMVARAGAPWAVPVDITPADLAQVWIVRRFVDPDAQWWAVARDQIALVSERFETGRLAVADKIAQHPGALSARFEKLSQSLANPEINAVLDAHIAAGDTGAAGMETIFPMLDALWAMTGR